MKPSPFPTALRRSCLAASGLLLSQGNEARKVLLLTFLPNLKQPAQRLNQLLCCLCILGSPILRVSRSDRNPVGTPELSSAWNPTAKNESDLRFSLPQSFRSLAATT